MKLIRTLLALALLPALAFADFNPGPIKLWDSTGTNYLAIDGAGKIGVTGTFWQATQPVSGTFWQGTQPISASALPLPTGAALDATLADSFITGFQETSTASTWNLIAASQTTTATDALGYRSIGIQVEGISITSVSITFEGSNDNTNFVSVPLFDRANPTTAPTASLGGSGAPMHKFWDGPISFRYIRARLTSLTGTSINVFTRLSTAPFFTGQTQLTSSQLPATLVSPADSASISSGQLMSLGISMLYNGATFDRSRGNFATTTGDTGAKTVTFNGATQTNFNARGAYVYVNVGTVSGTTPTMAVQFQGSFDGGTTWVNVGPAAANLTTTSTNDLFIVYPTNISQTAGVTPANLTTGATNTVPLNTPLPRTWRLVYTIAGTTPSFTITNVQVSYMN